MGKQSTFAGLAWNGKRESDAPGAILGRNGRGASLAAFDFADRAVLPEGRARPASAGPRETTSDLLSSAMVQSVRSSGRGLDLRQRVDVPLRRRRAGRRRGPGRVDDSSLSSPSGETRADGSDLPGDQRSSRGEAAALEVRDHRRRNDHFGSVDQKCPRKGDPEMRQTKKGICSSG